ncbi:MAG: hypothetical protein CSYNP_01672 [Syntrophus sp. SKADARSKE-3]|nr:hypothetical protein [Syntrophus sp. SKADARSKE-3]
MPITTMTHARYIERPSIDIHHHVVSRLPLWKRLTKFVETSDWEDSVLGIEKLGNRFCMAILILSSLYLAPLILFRFLG